MADDQEKDLQKFLKNVDEITTLIQEMNSDDPVVQQKAVLETEKRLLLMEEHREEDGCRTTLNKTTISPPQALAENADELSPEAFLASVEKDAKERAKRRRENQVLADALKEEGNEAFVKGDYETAVLRYSQGLEKLKDMKVLYTNRAQAYIKLGDYQKALVDCDWALKCDEKCTKAYFHMGKAHLALKNYSASRECYQKILEINPKLQTQVKEYLNQVDLREKADLQEKEAHELLDSGKNTAVTTKNLLESLSKPDQMPLFYAGGIEILTEMMKDCTERTLFRTHGGFHIISDNGVIRRCFSMTGKDVVEETVCVSVLKLWQAVCSENEENQRLLVMHPDWSRLLPSLLASRVLAVQQQSLALLVQLAQTENGRSLVFSHLDLIRLLEALLSFLEFLDKKANTAMGLLTDLALDERFQVWFQANLPGALPALTGVLKKDPKATNLSALCQCIAIMGNLSAVPAARKHMAACEDFGDACLGFLARCEEDMNLFREIAYTLLGLLMNLCLQVPFVSEVWPMEVSRRCLSLLNSQDGGILTRAAGVLSRTLSSSLNIIKEAVRTGVVKKMVKFLKTGGQTASRYAIKILAICTNSYHEAREEVIRLDKKFSILMKLLSSEDEVLVGNAALCLGNCMEVPSVASSLLKTDLVPVLLKLAASDSQKSAVQLNAGIALGKLCTAEPRFATQLRELHGMEILNSTTKYIHNS
ncbi:tetratricopeptide repeat protein 12 [Sciurus carolinensis]|uniref:tetratricopeptide repeat protein 12 n=1 Tax=Sciurus carolinensis TaxID=30640 RepID=UPI001FB29E8F|nr:tetratricopeptide repeat protein 12 [Sciurus carolinensis]XP_047375227.1 tetratricopeptide repeat protein 12 [Sciurus carolinensis]XP_047375228.1 tetratricopeptide repeat protein 12 [Sciurus carolinensis]